MHQILFPMPTQVTVKIILSVILLNREITQFLDRIPYILLRKNLNILKSLIIALLSFKIKVYLLSNLFHNRSNNNHSVISNPPHNINKKEQIPIQTRNSKNVHQLLKYINILEFNNKNNLKSKK